MKNSQFFKKNLINEKQYKTFKTKIKKQNEKHFPFSLLSTHLNFQWM